MRFSGFTIITLLLACLFALPVVVVYFSLLTPQPDLWRHLAHTVLSSYVTNSLVIAFGVGLLAAALGTFMAWLTTRYEFYGRTWLQWLLLLPLAIPAYIMAYSYTGLLDFAGPLQSLLRAHFGWSYGEYYFPEIRSLGGAVLMLSLVLYPYVYMLARTAFREQSASLFESSRILGLTPRQHFWRVALPVARPAILTGMALAMMEALADYGTVHYFGVTTFTTGIFRTWFGMGNRLGAAQLAALLCSFVLVLLFLEQRSRRTLKFYQARQVLRPPSRQCVSKPRQFLLALLCFLPVLLGFIIPTLQLMGWALERFEEAFSADFIRLVWNSFRLAAMTALMTVSLALLFAYAKRLRSHWTMQLPVRIASLGYALPGTVIAIGVMIPLAAVDNHLDLWAEEQFGIRLGLLFSGTLGALVIACTVRFLAVALHGLDAGLERITPSMDQAARSLGESHWGVLRRVHFPLLRPSLLVAFLLVFVDVLKELPATLLLRPFNFNTLSVRSYELASDELLSEASLPALAIVLVGIVPVILLVKALESSSQRERVC